MNTENNVVSLEHSVVVHVEHAVIDILENRGGRWVGQHIVTGAADRVAFPNMNSMQVINGMISSGLIERSFQTVLDKFGSRVELPLYRLPPFWK